MRTWTKLRLRMRSLLRPGAVDRELEAELAYHRAAAGEVHKTAGRDAEWEACRDQRRVAAVENFVQDGYRAVRRLARTPGFTLTAVLVLGFGMAAATAMFSLCDGLLLRPMPGVSNGMGLVHLEAYQSHELVGDMSYPDYADYRDQSQAYTLPLAASSNFQFDLSETNGTETLGGELVSGDYFSTLGVRAETGRLLAPTDDVAGNNRVVVLSDSLWRRVFAADRGIVGRAIELSHTVTLTVVGVAGPDFRGVSQDFPADLWIPITLQPAVAPMGPPGGNCLTTRFCGWVTAVARLRPGVSLAQAQSEADTIAMRAGAVHPEVANRRVNVVPGLGVWSDDRANRASFLGLLLIGTLLLAAMTAASLGSLFLARMGGRQHEVATQLALGAGRWRVARQFLLEAGWIAGAGAALGLAAATPVARWLLSLAPTAPQNFAVALDARVLAFSLGLAVMSALAMALAPALLTSRRGRIAAALAQGGRGASAARHRIQHGLLAAQVAVALLLLIAAGLAARTLQAATAGQVPAGADHIVLARVDTGHGFYTGPQASAFFQQLQSRLAVLPGIQVLAMSSCLEPAPCDRGPVFLPSAEPPAAVIRSREFSSTYLRPDTDWVSPGFFALYQHRLLQGRTFTTADRAGAPLVCVINERLAQRLWPGENPIGRQLAWPQFNWTGPHDFTVIGVIADRRSNSLMAPGNPRMYVAEAQAPLQAMWVAARSSLPAAVVLADVRTQVAQIDARIPVLLERTLAEQVRRTLWQPLAIASLSGLFGVLAAVLAAIGLFGTLAQLVQERRRELGVRLTLGATPRGLVAMVVRDGLAPLAAGLGLGGLAALACGGLLRPWLFGVTTTDPRAWGLAAALLAAIALGSTWLAASRAARVEPLEALRCE